MRKFLFVVSCLLLCASVSLAQGKVDSHWNCAKATDTHSIEVGDQSNHAYTIGQSTCTATKSEIGGVNEKDAVAAQFVESTGNSSSWHGHFVVTTDSGDKIFYRYSGHGTNKDGQFDAGSNFWSIVGGTGKFKGAKGKGTCTGKGGPDGSASWDCTGTYTLAQ
jgi:hypothetical protein